MPGEVRDSSRRVGRWGAATRTRELEERAPPRAAGGATESESTHKGSEDRGRGWRLGGRGPYR